MRDAMSWSIPLGRMFGISIRLHVLFPVVALGFILRAATQKEPVPLPGTWQDVAMFMGLLVVAVLLHEFGHCFGARSVEGDAHEILLWPLGGLAYCEVPQTPRANFITAAAGPAVNLLLCLFSVLLFLTLTEFKLRPTWNPFWYPFRETVEGTVAKVHLLTWDNLSVGENGTAVVVLARFFWINWVLFLLNLVLVGFPMDGGRMLQCILWPRWGYRQATLTVVYAGFVILFVLIVAGIIVNEIMPVLLGLFIFVSCKQQWMVLEMGSEDSMFGYDFSQGYTSLERDAPPPPRRRRQSWWQRWQQRRAVRKLQQEQEEREAEETRMDQLLEKVQQLGLAALTEEERRFMKRVSDKYRNRH